MVGRDPFCSILFLYDSRFAQSSLDQFKIKLVKIAIFKHHLALYRKHYEEALLCFSIFFFTKVINLTNLKFSPQYL